MSKTGQNLFKTIATRTVIAVIPVAMASAYASNMMVPTPPRLAEYAYQQVAEITVSPDTVGVAESPLYGQTKQQIDAQLDQLQALGVQSIRVFVPWGLIDYYGPSAAGSASWSQIDLVMQAAKERNMGVLAEFDSTPPYAVTGGSGSNTPDPAAFSAFLTKFVNAYGSTVSAYEIWNEENGVLSSNPISPSSYAALLKAAYNTIKPLDPTATVVMGGLGHVITVNGLTMDPVDFVNAMIAADPTIGNYFDALAYHPYDNTTSLSGGNLNPALVGPWAADTAYNQVKDLMSLFPSKKVWITEFGVPTYTYTDYLGNVYTITQAQQAALIQDFLSNWSSLGSQAGPVFLYTGQDTQTGSTDPEKNYGLYDDQGNPKSVIAWLTQWFIDHPQIPVTPTTPTTPTTPGAAANPLAAIIQSIVQSFTHRPVPSGLRELRQGHRQRHQCTVRSARRPCRAGDCHGRATRHEAGGDRGVGHGERGRHRDPRGGQGGRGRCGRRGTCRIGCRNSARRRGSGPGCGRTRSCCGGRGSHRTGGDPNARRSRGARPCRFGSRDGSSARARRRTRVRSGVVHVTLVHRVHRVHLRHVQHGHLRRPRQGRRGLLELEGLGLDRLGLRYEDLEARQDGQQARQLGQGGQGRLVGQVRFVRTVGIRLNVVPARKRQGRQRLLAAPRQAQQHVRGRRGRQGRRR
jgi:hypothetical protein